MEGLAPEDVKKRVEQAPQMSLLPLGGECG